MESKNVVIVETEHGQIKLERVPLKQMIEEYLAWCQEISVSEQATFDMLEQLNEIAASQMPRERASFFEHMKHLREYWHVAQDKSSSLPQDRLKFKLDEMTAIRV